MTAQELRRGALQLLAAVTFGAIAWVAAVHWWWPVEDVDVAPASNEGAAPPAREVLASMAAPSPVAPVPAEDRPADLADGDDLAFLRARGLQLPVPGVEAEDLADDFADERSGGRRHEAIDILAPRDTPVYAVDEGTIAKLFESEFGGLTVYQFDATGRFSFYYAHLERYPRGLTEGATVKRGDTIGFVGSSGNAPEGTPHLHFAIYRLGAERRWWEGEPINPFLVFTAR